MLSSSRGEGATEIFTCKLAESFRLHDSEQDETTRWCTCPEINVFYLSLSRRQNCGPELHFSLKLMLSRVASSHFLHNKLFRRACKSCYLESSTSSLVRRGSVPRFELGAGIGAEEESITVQDQREFHLSRQLGAEIRQVPNNQSRYKTNESSFDR